MVTTIEKMDTQLRYLLHEIDRFAEAALSAGGPVGYYTIMQIDELKALHAVAHAKFEEFKFAGELKQTRLMTELQKSVRDLEVAFRFPDS